jgi:hypothetical protein
MMNISFSSLSALTANIILPKRMMLGKHDFKILCTTHMKTKDTLNDAGYPQVGYRNDHAPHISL